MGEGQSRGGGRPPGARRRTWPGPASAALVAGIALGWAGLGRAGWETPRDREAYAGTTYGYERRPYDSVASSASGTATARPERAHREP